MLHGYSLATFKRQIQVGLLWCLHLVSVFQHLLDEQVSKKKGSYLVSFGTDIDPLWPVVRDVNERM